jgi:putative addiction module component (TIGR02574 family)
MTVQQIVAEARQLSRGELADLVDALLGETAESDPAVDEAWKVEVRRRVAEIETGQVESIPGEQVMAEVRKIVGL